jgi:glyoxylase-like metal-dependent hydrolase (beta-lactamase superfamily II)
MALSVSPGVICVPDLATGTCQWLFWCSVTKKAVVVDPVHDYDSASGRFSASNVDKLVEHVVREGLVVEWVLETHVHADHVSGAQVLRRRFPGAKVGIGAGVTVVQAHCKKLFNLAHVAPDGSCFDRLLKEGDELRVGETLRLTALSTPGHTPDGTSYVIDNCGVCVGDTLFYPDCGTARCDFPGGDAGVLRESIAKILARGDETRLFLCHDYPKDGRSFQSETTVGAERANNIHLQPGTDFVELRTQRDRTLKIPHLLVPSVQLNIAAGALPPPEDNGVSYIKVPLNVLNGCFCLFSLAHQWAPGRERSSAVIPNTANEYSTNDPRAHSFIHSSENCTFVSPPPPPLLAP